MLAFVAILVVLWFIGLIYGVIGDLIHLLLVVIVVALIFNTSVSSNRRS